MPSISRRLQGSQEHVQSVFFLWWWEEITDTYCFSCSWLAYPSMCNTQMLQLLKKSQNVYEKMYTVLNCILLPIGNKQISLSTKKGFSCLWLAMHFKCDGLNVEQHAFNCQSWDIKKSFLWVWRVQRTRDVLHLPTAKSFLGLDGFRSRWLPFPHWQRFVSQSDERVSGEHS